jgi:hypothetical protein
MFSKDIIFALCFASLGFSAGYIVKEQFFTEKCPQCPECPPQTVLYINNEKIKAKGNGTIDLKSLLQVESKENLQLTDSTKSETKRKGFLGKIFNKK